MILLVCAVVKELDWLGPRADTEVLVGGVGPVDSAARVARALAQRHYDVVINAGIAGAFRGAAKVGDGVVVGEELLELNLETGERISLPDGLFVADRVPADVQLVETITSLGFPQVRGITVSRVTATDATAERLGSRGAEIESMEGFAVLRAAQLAGIPALELRGISNYVGDRAQSEWDFDAGLGGLRRVLNATLDLLHTTSNVD
ncbi:MAG TPA: futalosine hydrolase [Candidatus Baltobacteraceae bacterium]|jgi:futalosine hydrolase|nr:futalosine hydrolase [Candidatus Baltobacteraceae bacterium]